MERYTNSDGGSGVSDFEIGNDSITVGFSTGSVYLYTYASTGEADIEQMKNLAKAGKGLNEFINRTVRKRFERKLK